MEENPFKFKKVLYMKEFINWLIVIVSVTLLSLIIYEFGMFLGFGKRISGLIGLSFFFFEYVIGYHFEYFGWRKL